MLKRRSDVDKAVASVRISLEVSRQYLSDAEYDALLRRVQALLDELARERRDAQQSRSERVPHDVH